MVSKTVTIKNATGLHLRPAGLFCKTAMKFDCNIHVEKIIESDRMQSFSNAKSVLSILGACIKHGDSIILRCEGHDEVEALEAMVQIVEDGLGE